MTDRFHLTALRAAAQTGDAEAAYRLALNLAMGAGGEAEWEQAMRWFALAVDGGQAVARNQVHHLKGWQDQSAWPVLPEPIPLCRAPVILSFERFLPSHMCDWLRSRANDLVEPGRVFDETTGLGRQDPGRTNSAGSFGLQSADMILALARRRISAISGVPTIAFETTQVLSYAVGQIFDWHVDYLDPAKPAFASDVTRRGQRIATCLIFLNDDFEGGETAFTADGLRHRGRTGDALLWSNVLPDGRIDRDTVHAGLPPTQGSKWVLSQWIRDKPQSSPSEP